MLLRGPHADAIGRCLSFIAQEHNRNNCSLPESIIGSGVRCLPYMSSLHRLIALLARSLARSLSICEVPHLRDCIATKANCRMQHPHSTPCELKKLNNLITIIKMISVHSLCMKRVRFPLHCSSTLPLSTPRFQTTFPRMGRATGCRSWRNVRRFVFCCAAAAAARETRRHCPGHEW